MYILFRDSRIRDILKDSGTVAVMKIAIVGPGALGTLFAAFFCRSGVDATLLDYRPDRVSKLARSGVVVEAGEETFHLHPQVISWEQAISRNSNFDVILLLVKAYVTSHILEELQSISHRNTLIITLQNGIGHEQILSRAFSKRQIVIGTTAIGANKPSDNLVRFAGHGQTRLGFAFNDHSHLSELKQFLARMQKAGFQGEITVDIKWHLWQKLFANVGINAITALLCGKNGVLLQVKHARQVMVAAVKEAVDLHNHLFFRQADLDHVIAYIDSICENTCENISSMLQDRLFHRFTEIDYINGAVVRISLESGLQAPVNSTLTSLIKALQVLKWKNIV